MASTATELMMRRMGAKSGGIDWATIGHGMVDYTTPFSVPAEIIPTISGIGDKTYMFIFRGNLQSIDFESLSYIPERFCQGCTSLTTITFPTTMIRIGGYSFYGCTSLQEVIVQKDTPPALGANVFGNCTSLAVIYVPDASVSAYQGASQWSTYASIIKPISQRP
jgi:hypothetical protein